MERIDRFTETGRSDFVRWVVAVAPGYNVDACVLDALNSFEESHAAGNSLSYEMRVNGRPVEYHASESDFVFETVED